MFTGIVEETGQVVRREGSRLVVHATVARDGMELGSSLAVNGVCLTAVELGGEHLAFDLGPETLARSALGDLEAGDHVNLERPMRLDGFVGGHLVLGHVDGIGLVTASKTDGETARIRVEWHATIDVLLSIMGQEQLLQANPQLERSIRNRFPYMDPLNHVQVELLKAHRTRGEDEQVLRGIQLTINGISAGLRNSG